MRGACGIPVVLCRSYRHFYLVGATSSTCCVCEVMIVLLYSRVVVAFVGLYFTLSWYWTAVGSYAMKFGVSGRWWFLASVGKAQPSLVGTKKGKSLPLSWTTCVIKDSHLLRWIEILWVFCLLLVMQLSTCSNCCSVWASCQSQSILYYFVLQFVPLGYRGTYYKNFLPPRFRTTGLRTK